MGLNCSEKRMSSIRRQVAGIAAGGLRQDTAMPAHVGIYSEVSWRPLFVGKSFTTGRTFNQGSRICVVMKYDQTRCTKSTVGLLCLEASQKKAWARLVDVEMTVAYDFHANYPILPMRHKNRQRSGPLCGLSQMLECQLWLKQEVP